MPHDSALFTANDQGRRWHHSQPSTPHEPITSRVNDDGSGTPIYTSFVGETGLNQNAILVRYVNYGDANLDRTVDTIDFNLLAANFGQSDVVWGAGNFNYDGGVDTVDFNLLASNFAKTLV